MQDVAALQSELQQKANQAVTSLEDTVLNNWFYPRHRQLSAESQDSAEETASAVQSVVVGLITTLTVSQGDSTVLAWAQLLPKLITKYHDGYRAENLDKEAIAMKKLFYNKFWLDATGYWNNKPNTGGDTIMFQPGPSSFSSSGSASSMMIISFMIAVITFLIGLRVGTQLKSSKSVQENSINDDQIEMSTAAGFQEVKSSILSHVPFDLRFSSSSINKQAKPNRRDYVSLEI
jgi:hypothetical protein